MSAVLAVKFADLEVMTAALTTAHGEIERLVGDARRTVNAELSGWSTETASRIAQQAHDAKLAAAVSELNAQLAQIRDALNVVKTAAHDAEVRCVAIMD